MKNTNSARGLFYIPSSCFYSERDTHTELVLVSLCRVVISAFHELYKVCLDKDVNILHLSDIVSVLEKARQTAHGRSDHVHCGRRGERK